jgi:1-aminocyclopropane-1-carboxylate deaminase
MPETNPTCRIDSLNQFYDFHATVDVLRLDLLHPVISGNKWFKLKFHLVEAREQNKVLLTLGGAYSNHIAATAAAAKDAGIRCIGIIRGEEADSLSHTLAFAQAQGMELYFVSRSDYRNKTIPPQILRPFAANNLLIVPEGGYGEKGAAGAKDILLENDTAHYTHVVAAVGTGTTLAGVIAAAGDGQRIIGISVLKNNLQLHHEIAALLPTARKEAFLLLHDYHFGGYARRQPKLIDFMNQLYATASIPTDFVYTGKLFYAAFDLLQNNYFAKNDRVLLIHSGGLQGNLSLPKGTLIFS